LPSYLNIILIALSSWVIAIPQANAETKDDHCVTSIKEVYIDSLSTLLLANRPISVIQIADSLISIYGHLACSEVYTVRAARGSAYELLYIFEPALESYLEILASAERQDLKKDQAWISLSLARVYEAIGRDQLCYDYLKNARKLIDDNNFNEYLSRYYVRMASYQRLYANRDSARIFAQRAIELGQQYGVKRSFADGNLVLGIVTDDKAESLIYFQKAADTFLEMGDYSGSMYQELNIATILFEQKKFEQVNSKLRYINRQIPFFEDNKKRALQVRLGISSLKAKLYELNGQTDSLNIELKNKIHLIGELDYLVNQEKINQLIIDNSVSIEREKTKAANRKFQFLLISSILLSLILLLTIWNFVSNRKKNQKIKEQSKVISKQYEDLEKLYNYKSTLLNEVHHRIKNNLQLIISLLIIQKSKLDSEQSSDMLDMLTNRLYGVALIHEQLYSQNLFETIAVKTYLEGLVEKFKSFTPNQQISFNTDIEVNLVFNLETIEMVSKNRTVNS